MSRLDTKSNLCEYFLAKGEEVVCLDNFSTGHRYNVAPFLSNANLLGSKGSTDKSWNYTPESAKA